MRWLMKIKVQLVGLHRKNELNIKKGAADFKNQQRLFLCLKFKRYNHGEHWGHGV